MVCCARLLPEVEGVTRWSCARLQRWLGAMIVTSPCQNERRKQGEAGVHVRSRILIGVSDPYDDCFQAFIRQVNRVKKCGSLYDLPDSTRGREVIKGFSDTIVRELLEKRGSENAWPREKL